MCEGKGSIDGTDRQLRVLIVEDEALVADDLAGTIEATGAQVVAIADDSRDAVRFAADHRPDVVLMDIRLRNNDDGIEAAQAIRVMMDIPIIFCTGCGDPVTRRRVQEFGKAELVPKPVDYECLIQTITRVCAHYYPPPHLGPST